MRLFLVIVLLVSVECFSQDSTRFEPIFGNSNEPYYALDSLIQTSENILDIYGSWKLVKTEGRKTEDSKYAGIELEFKEDNRIFIISREKTNSYIYIIKGSHIELYYTTGDTNLVTPINVRLNVIANKARKIEVKWGGRFSEAEGQIWTFRKK
ncbi:MAG: hypothetical protein NXI10_17435 [bacterium]|nr:hypothetical protein [bacterium]